MRAAIRTGLLGLGISFSKDVPLPASLDATDVLDPSAILIKVKSAAINPVDYKLPRAIGGKILGLDVSGVVDRIGADVTDFQVGDEIFGRTTIGKGSGSLADYALVNKEEVAKKPEWLPFDHAAALPTAYLTGIESLHVGNVKEGSIVMIIGASGGCGIAGVQLAKAMGAARIVGICSGKNFEFVREMCGIKDEKKLELVDYTDEEALKNFRDNNTGLFDCIYDTATGSGNGEDYVGSMLKLLKQNTGQYVQINGSGSTWTRHFMGKMKPQTNMVLTSSKSKSRLEETVSLLKLSELKPYIDVKPFDEKGVADGFEQLKGRRTKGKIVFNMD